MSEKRFTYRWGSDIDYEQEIFYDNHKPIGFVEVVGKLNEQQATISALKEENEQLQQIMKDIVVATDETYAKNMSMFKVTVVLDYEKYREIKECLYE